MWISTLEYFYNLGKKISDAHGFGLTNSNGEFDLEEKNCLDFWIVKKIYEVNWTIAKKTQNLLSNPFHVYEEKKNWLLDIYSPN